MEESGMIDTLIQLDKQATLWLNYDGGWFQDALWWAFSSRWMWLPLAVVFLCLLVRSEKKWSDKVLIVMGLATTVLLCDQLSASVCKPLVMRLRPSHDPSINELLHYVHDYRGGRFGFVSSHAANVFGMFAFLTLTERRRWVEWGLLALSLAVCYSRIYLGVHFLGDVLGGSLLGVAVGGSVAFGVHWLMTHHLYRWRFSHRGSRRQLLGKGICLILLCSLGLQTMRAEPPVDTARVERFTEAVFVSVHFAGGHLVID